MRILPSFLLFALALALMLALSRWIGHQVQVVGWRLTRSERAAMVGYYLLLLPGIVLHELSHAGMARLLGLKVGKLTLGPRRHGKYVELGSVRVASGGALRDSLVGLAPFLAGTTVLLLVSYLAFDVDAVLRAWTRYGLPGMGPAISNIWRTPDFAVWAYVVFTVGNAMTPSPADRQPWLTAGLYIGIAAAVVLVLGGVPTLPDAFVMRAIEALQLLTLAFGITVALDLVVAAVLVVLEGVIIRLSGQQ